MVKKSLYAIAMIIAMAGCSKENVSPEKKAIKLNISQENVTTRAAINQTNAKQIIWSAGDKISVFDEDLSNNAFTLTSGEGSTSGSFEGTVSKEGKYSVLYPYQQDAIFDGTKLSSVTLSSTQKAVEGSFDPSVALMTGEGDTDRLQLNNAIGYIKLTPGIDCTAINFKSNDDSQYLSGDITITFDENGAPIIDGGSQNYVTLTGDIKAGSTYYLAVIPAKLTDGFTISFTTTDGTVYSRESSEGKTLEIKRNCVTDLGAVTKSSKHTFASGDFGLTGEIGVDLYKIDGPATTAEGYKWYLEPTMNEPLFYWRVWGLQIGAGWSTNTDLHVKSMRLYTSDIPGTIKAVKVTCSDNDSSKQVGVSVKVGENTFGSAQKLSNDMTTFTFTGSASGQIEILWNSDEDGVNYYLQSVEIIYQN